LPGIEIRIIAISDGPLPELAENMIVEDGNIGEIIVRGDVVTRAYLNNPEETGLAKIQDGDSFWHRLGDVGYFDHGHRLWFCGRRAHRVVTKDRTYFSVPCEAIINEHPDVYRSALVGIKDCKEGNETIPVIIVEPQKDRIITKKLLLQEVKIRAAQSDLTREIQHFLIHKNFPVDIRHNAKIFREKLAIWAQKKLSPCR
jgi:acyl-CoA synthetase (AMP-forming)/AMP-acid ligase II